MVQRGFGTKADRLAAEVRSELKLGLHDRFDPHGLAEKYGISVVPITDLVAQGADPASVRQLTVTDPRSFSAGTVRAGTSRLIIFNPVHPDGRLANSVTHEESHLLLEHSPGPAIGPGGCRIWDKEVEDEANLLVATILVPRDAALACARKGLPHAIGAARFGVSSELMRWRTDHSGAAQQARAEAQKYRRTIPRMDAPEVRQVISPCDLNWLQGLTAQQWQQTLEACGRALVVTGSAPALIDCLQRTAAMSSTSSFRVSW
jgi:Zn-dependent peptidase ImmA (M78 family)